MTQEEKYKEALERASKLRVQNPFDTVGQMVEHIFPELAESEDEKIRKEIIAFLYSKNGYMTPSEDWDFHDRWLTWLEKQGEQKPTIPKWKYKKDHTPLLRDSIILNKYGCVAKSPSGALVSDVWVLDYGELAKLPKEVLEKQGEHKSYGQRKECEDCQFNYVGECKGYCALKRNEQKPILDVKASDWYVSKVDGKIHNMYYSVDKVEPKFKVGDWVVNSTTLNLCHILKVGYGQYICDDCSFPITKENEYHLWTIQDAKDGDVLVASDGSIFLFAGVVDCACKYYVALATDNCVKINKEAKGGYWETSRVVYPATKEQRELLFQKMKEAGYEWDAEKKELKKIEHKFNVDEWIVTDDSFGKIVRHVDEIRFNIIDKGYVVSDENGLFYNISFSKEHKWHKWTIQDAKDGDVLVDSYSKDSIIILYKGIYKERSILAHCGWNGYNFSVKTNGLGYGGLDNTNYLPATKEQRDLLFQKMKEAGYEWDQKEKKLIKMKETKFKVGDWVVTDYGRVSRVVSVDKYGDGYTLDDGVYFSGSWCDKYHLWTIQDAKDGDVLVAQPPKGLGSNEQIFLFKAINSRDYVEDGCIEYYFRLFDDVFYKNTIGHMGTTLDVFYPATKEQRDLLFQKMEEAGYEWDAEKKVLSKRDMGILPEAKMQAYIKHCNDKSPSNIFCDKCNKSVTIERQYPYFYDKDENDVYFASICPECGELLITKE